ncbi:TauD-domain-containing protein [Hortaea werneckii]|nr:TauD-domain-containing protein [Hortaea werneckii]KAI7099658.1 TauD-domain-containing protein [Hortaea werneckii]KAI7219294.1 TauD-domain-containing protein [Hortaea werneckii]KAI7299627.1 TauD-domain-containing protein [Hortaea werneckii]KAI7386976.1 TauD-domain-containing protein [Hortaea werneckii]
MATVLTETIPVRLTGSIDQKTERLKTQDKRESTYKEAFAQSAATTNYDGELKGSEKHPPAACPHYLPYWDNVTYPPLEPFEAIEHGKDADPTFPNLLAGAHVSDLTANIGAEVQGVQISQLNSAGKDELALFVAKKKVVAFRSQDLADLPIQQALDFAEYYGPSHIHQASGAPKGFPKVHLIHRSADDTTARDFFQERTNSITWHSDVSFEMQPPGTTFLYLLDGPTAGGDTLFGNMVEAYNRLSPEFQKRLHGLKAIHSGHEQAADARARGSVVRREPVANVHPLVRTHPATGEKALYVNPQFTRRIVGLKKEESDYLLKFLYDHIALCADLQARVKWEKGSVICWDNRVTAHTAILDWQDGQRRHLARLTPQAERPYETPFDE